ncbi:peptidoglycan-associated lipoprotein, partial [Pseudomonas syringae]
ARMTPFDSDIDEDGLTARTQRLLQEHAKGLQANGAQSCLEGKTDDRGTREYNMALGGRRAKAVRRYLVLQGVSPAQLELVSYGEERPVATGNDEQSLAQNRRLELRK